MTIQKNKNLNIIKAPIKFKTLAIQSVSKLKKSDRVYKPMQKLGSKCIEILDRNVIIQVWIYGAK